MDPLTVVVFTILGAVVSEALGADKESFSEYYDRDIEIYRSWVVMRGRNVNWWVTPGEAVWIKAKYLRPISGNIFYSEKLGAVARTVRAADERPVDFYAPYGQISLIGASEIEESIQYAEYDGAPFTTGDDALDEWLADRGMYLDNAGLDGEDRAEMSAELEDDLRLAEINGDGDFGQWTASVRDGNHRAFGSVMGGEERVAIRIYDNDMIALQEHLRTGRSRNRSSEKLIEKSISDTGKLAHWMERYRSRIPLLNG